MSTASTRDSAFGAGGDEPYEAALQTDGRLVMRSDDRPGETLEFDVARWSAMADATDVSLFDFVDGPVIDLGCGPGRMLVAAQAFGLPALGVDLSSEAAQRARRSGVEVLVGSVFDEVPDEGRWDTAFLIDGNIGIGGSPAALLARTRDILRSGGSAIVETHPDDGMDRVFTATVSDASGRRSAEFPWAATGADALARYAVESGFEVRATWRMGGRAFVRLVSV